MVAVGSFAFAGRAEPAASLEPPLSPLSVSGTHCVYFCTEARGMRVRSGASHPTLVRCLML